MNDLNHLHYSEDFAISSQPKTKFDLDLVQYEVRDFGFWNADKRTRSVNRFMDSNNYADNSAYDIHPLDTNDLPDIVCQNLVPENLLHFPAVFKTRVYGEQSVNTLQEWECVVISLNEDFVESRAISLMEEDASEDRIEIPLVEFSPSDRLALCPGVVFRLIIGFSKKANGSRSREAICYIRRHLPLRSKADESVFGGL